ncbi:MAG: hypothetical protein NC393_08270 [Clostridium sp.]|nr:hypothetical protein [Clostridium sp.]MCM1208986.1 hypothetical protein [Ruminococcus sp.]
MDKVDELIEKLAKDIIDKMNKDLPVVQQIKALAELINARAIHSKISELKKTINDEVKKQSLRCGTS